jgi:hypothetical protein
MYRIWASPDPGLCHSRSGWPSPLQVRYRCHPPRIAACQTRSVPRHIAAWPSQMPDLHAAANRVLPHHVRCAARRSFHQCKGSIPFVPPLWCRLSVDTKSLR